MQIEAGGAKPPPAQADKDSRLVLEEESKKREDLSHSGGLGGETNVLPIGDNLQADMQVGPQKGGQASKVYDKPAASENKQGEAANLLAQMHDTQDQQMELDETPIAKSPGPTASDSPQIATAGFTQEAQEAPPATKVVYRLDQEYSALSSGERQQNTPPGKPLILVLISPKDLTAKKAGDLLFPSVPLLFGWA